MHVEATVVHREGSGVGLQSRNIVEVDLLSAGRLRSRPSVHMGEAIAVPCGRHAVRLFFVECKVNIMVFALAAHAQSPRLDPGENDPDKLAKRCWVQWHHSFSTATIRILRIDSIARDRRLRRLADRTQPVVDQQLNEMSSNQ